MVAHLDVVEALPFSGRGWLLVGRDGTELFVRDLSVTEQTRPDEWRRAPGYRPPGHSYDECSHHEQRLADRKAETLLVSLLDQRQRREWEQGRTFWVPVEGGVVRLGVFYRLLHARFDDFGRWRVLCVISDDHGAIPPADEWVAMLLALRAVPERFFDVAIVRANDAFGSTDESARAIDDARRESSARHRSIDVAYIDAAHAARLLGEGDVSAALAPAVRAAVMLTAHGTAGGGPHGEWRATHRSLFDRATSLAWCIGDVRRTEDLVTLALQSAAAQCGDTLDSATRAIGDQLVTAAKRVR